MDNLKACYELLEDAQYFINNAAREGELTPEQEHLVSALQAMQAATKRLAYEVANMPVKNVNPKTYLEPCTGAVINHLPA